MPSKGNKKKGSNEFESSDPRFAQIYSDPRFRAPKSRDLKVQLDDRFTKEDLKLGKSSAKVDKYGRAINKATDGEGNETQAFDKLYSTKSNEKAEEKGGEEEDQEESEQEDETDIMARARGLVSAEESSESESSESDSDEEVVQSNDDDKDVFEEVEEEESIPEGEPTKRIAAVNLDWDHITSKDLFATFSGFVPAGRKILNISIYPSEFGKIKMQEEETQGPSKEIFKGEKKKIDSDNEDDAQEDEDDDGELDIRKAAKELYTEDEGLDYNSKALRKYQLQRLRYYYAIVVCDSVECAKSIYTNCDGTEYESTANTFDLRYVPEGMEFSESEPRDSCDTVPLGYQPTDFATDALRSSKVKLTWDETPAQRIEMTTRAFSQKEIDDMDFQAYLASDSSDSEDDASKVEDLKAKFKNLLHNGETDAFGKGDDSDASDIDMEVTFTPGLSGAKESADKGEEEEETTVERYRNKEKERKKKRKEKIKELKKKEREERKEKHLKKGNRYMKDAGEKNASDSVTEEKEGRHHFKMKDIMKAEKLKHKKKKNRKQRKEENELQNIDEDIKLDEGDTRFNEIFESHEYAIDPTNPEFKKTTVMEKLIRQGQKRAKENNLKKNGDTKRKKHPRDEDKEEIKALVKDVKKLKNNGSNGDRKEVHKHSHKHHNHHRHHNNE
ncbi:hypothetical protein HII12_002961 [Brettanomyces bruxellensis]|uniref:NUC153 domain-containing protein n=1 Tax=Dekkera bruxellensis TaxID=5007 RepID=A0A8H6EU09_DEKBR|nr:hypothetical protein HII12_002961 [Brettanomyces bruxellensis]